MDQKPSTSKPECLSPRRKRPRGPFIASEKLMVRNVYKYIREEKAKECIAEYDFQMNITSECVEKTADILGIARTTVFKILKEHKEHKEFRPPGKCGPKRSFMPFMDKLSKADCEGIRRKIQEIEDANETPTFKKIHKLVSDDPALPNFSLSTLVKVMAHLKNTKENKSDVPVSNNNDDNDKTNEDSDAGDSTELTGGPAAAFELIEVKVEYSESEDDSS